MLTDLGLLCFHLYFGIISSSSVSNFFVILMESTVNLLMPLIFETYFRQGYICSFSCDYIKCTLPVQFKHMSTPIPHYSPSQSLSPPMLSIHISSYVSMYSRTHKWEKRDNICLIDSDSAHSLWLSPVVSILLQMTQIHSSFRLKICHYEIGECLSWQIVCFTSIMAWVWIPSTHTNTGYGGL